MERPAKLPRSLRKIYSALEDASLRNQLGRVQRLAGRLQERGVPSSRIESLMLEPVEVLAIEPTQPALVGEVVIYRTNWSHMPFRLSPEAHLRHDLLITQAILTGRAVSGDISDSSL